MRRRCAPVWWLLWLGAAACEEDPGLEPAPSFDAQPRLDAQAAPDATASRDAGDPGDAETAEVGPFDGGGRDVSSPDGAPDAGTPDATSPDAAPADSGSSYQPGPPCARPLAAADRDRFVVISLPTDPAGAPDNRYRVYQLSTTGELSDLNHEFRMGRARSGKTIAFTHDGRIGVSPQDDGTLGLFTLAPDGTPTVLSATFSGPFFAESVVMDPSSDRVWVLDSQWTVNGGGIYGVHLACADGTPSFEGKLSEAHLLYGLQFLAGGDAIAGAHAWPGSTAGHDTYRVDLGPPLAVTASANGFPAADPIIGGFAVTANGQHVIATDTSIVAPMLETAVVEITAGGLVPRQRMSEAGYSAFLASPFDDLVLAIDPFADGLYRFDYDPSSLNPFTFAGVLPANGPAILLPGSGVVVQRGGLRGLAVVSELVGLRRVRFEGNGTATDLGPYLLTTDPNRLDLLVGALGLTP